MAPEEDISEKISGYSLFDHLLEGCQIISSDWRYIYLNETALKHARKGKDELIGRTMEECYPGIESTPLFKTMQQVVSTGENARLENKFIYPDGVVQWFELSIQTYNGGLLILSRDITDRVKKEGQIQRHLNQLSALREIDIAIIGSMDLHLTLRIILDHINAQLEVDASSVLLLEEQGLRLIYAQGRGFQTEEIVRTKIKVGEGHAGFAALNRQTVQADLVEEKEFFIRQELLEREGFRTYIGAPLIVKGKVIGVLEIFNRTGLEPDRGWFDVLEALVGQTAIAVDNAKLFEELDRSNTRLELAYDYTLEGWSKALELRDDETKGHTQRVAEMTQRLATAVGVPATELIHIRRGALLHDIGKIGIPDAVLLKSGPLNKAEWKIMKQHPQFAYDLLYPIDYLRPALDIPYCHHERWDGSGYPRGLKGEGIPLAARLFAVVDVWDALLSDRPYRKAWPQDKAIEHLKENAGKQFDPSLVATFLDMIQGTGQD